MDHLQNIEGKSLACAYSARASEYAGASTPLTWKEVDDGVDRRDFTIRTLPERLAKVGDVWAPLMTATGVDLCFHNPDRAAQGFSSFHCVFYGQARNTARYRHSVFSENFFALILMDLHAGFPSDADL